MAQQLALLQSRAGSRMVTNPPQFRISGNPAMVSEQLSQRLDSISAVTHVFSLQEWQKMAVSNMVAGRNIILTAPTGSGKTCIPEVFSVLSREDGGGKPSVVLYFLGLSSLIEDKGRNAKVPTVWMNIGGRAMKKRGREEINTEDIDLESEEELEDSEANFKIEDVKQGKVNVIVLHAETIDTVFGKELLEYLEDSKCTSYIFVDEWQKNLHWRNIRPKMYSLVPRLMLQLKVPVVLATATILPSEVKTATDVWGVKNPVVIESSPVQEQHFLVTMPRPPSLYRFWGRDGKDNGVVSALSFILDPYCEVVGAGRRPEGNIIIFFHNKEWIGEADKELSLRLPDVPYTPDLSPWVMVHGSMDECDLADIFARTGAASPSLYLASSVVEVGHNLPRVDQTVQVGPYCRPHELLQCTGRGGRPERGEEGVRRSISYIMFNQTDLSSNLVSQDVKDFLTSEGCKKEAMAAMFGFHQQSHSEKSWCCVSCCGIKL